MVVNLIVVPAMRLFAVTVVDLDAVYAAGLLVFGMAAGALFLIKLAATSKRPSSRGSSPGWRGSATSRCTA